jgi:membrane protease YdiL (CAAX protease family)
VTAEATLELAAPSPLPQRWKFWATTFWAVAGVATFMVVGAVWMFALAVWGDTEPEPSMEHYQALLRSHQALQAAGFGVAAVCAFGVLALSIRLTGLGVREYLGLIRPRARDLGLGLVGLIAIYLAFWLVFYVVGNSPSRFAVNLYRDALTNGSLPMLLLGTVVAAPLGEELLIRGFLFRGWAASRLGPTGAIVLTALVWTFLHTQYDWLVLSQIFCIGLLYGWVRRRGGSTTATMILHAGQNAWSFAFFLLLDKLGLIAGA